MAESSAPRPAAGVRLIAWRKECRRPVEPDLAERYGGETSVFEWKARLVCSECGSHHVDMVVSGAERR